MSEDNPDKKTFELTGYTAAKTKMHNLTQKTAHSSNAVASEDHRHAIQQTKSPLSSSAVS